MFVWNYERYVCIDRLIQIWSWTYVRANKINASIRQSCLAFNCVYYMELSILVCQVFTKYKFKSIVNLYMPNSQISSVDRISTLISFFFTKKILSTRLMKPIVGRASRTLFSFLLPRFIASMRNYCQSQLLDNLCIQFAVYFKFSAGMEGSGHEEYWYH